jgi:hypothetical protein
MINLKQISIDGFDCVLTGGFEKISIPPNTVLDEESVIKTIQNYKTNFVEKGTAFGFLNNGFLLIPTEEGEEVDTQEKPPAFMIIDILWNSEKQLVEGTIIVLDTDDGNKIKQAVSRGGECYVSNSGIDIYTQFDKESGSLLSKASGIQNYHVSILDFS